MKLFEEVRHTDAKDRFWESDALQEQLKRNVYSIGLGCEPVMTALVEIAEAEEKILPSLLGSSSGRKPMVIET